MTASARRATSRATCSFAAWRARAAAVSSRRCWFATSGSRRSAIQRAPLARWTAAPTRWTDPGGDVVITASIPSRRAMRIAAGIAVRFQVTLASGRRRRRAVTCAWTRARSRPSAARSSSAGFRARGPTYRARWIHACVGTRSSGSRCTHFGSSGASTCVSMPSAGRYCASFSERCTPPPPAGGKYIVTSSTFTAGKGRAGIRPVGQTADTASRAAATVASISASPCSVETKPASYCDGAR